MRRIPVLLCALMLVGLSSRVALASGSTGQTILFQPAFTTVPVPLPGNLPSEGGEAYAFSEFGDQVSFAGTDRALATVTVGLSSWGCESGHWYDDTCSTTPGAGFTEPVTFNVYDVGPADSVGTLIATETETFTIPYRPSADDSNCTGGRWFEASTATCFNGYATTISFDFSPLQMTLPDKVIYGIAYDTTHYGYQPIGESAPCYTSSGGCGYDSLNIAFTTAGPSIGADVDPTTVYQNASDPAQYCDGGAAGTGTFRLDSPSSGCWAPYTPAVEFSTGIPDHTYGDPDFGVTAVATSGLPVSFSSSGDCSVTDATVHITGAGSCTVTAHQDGDDTYAAAPDVSEGFSIAKADQTITFPTIATHNYGDPDFTLTATASSGLPVTYTASGPCTVSGSTLHITGTGKCKVTAHQGGDADYDPARNVTQAFSINRGPTTTTLVVNPQRVVQGATSTFTATVAPQNLASTLVPTGSVEFFVSGLSFGTAPLDSAGVGSITPTITLAPGTYYVQAVYTNSDGLWRASKSKQVRLVVKSP